jgi:hypothetical protein
MILIETRKHRVADGLGAGFGLACVAAVLAAVVLVPSSAEAGPLVVRASGPSAASFKPGQRLPDTPLVLKSGDAVTVLDKLGTRNFSGPGSFDFAAASQAAAPVAFTELLTQKPVRRARIGAVRSVGAEPAGAPAPPGIWAIDAAAGGTVCALDPAKMSLWRADPAVAAAVKITRSADGATANVNFRPGEAIATWPAALAPASGDRFAVSGDGLSSNLTIRQITAAPDALDALGAALIEKGCQSQFDRLVQATSKPNG